jgi:hypothetical protein
LGNNYKSQVNYLVISTEAKKHETIKKHQQALQSQKNVSYQRRKSNEEKLDKSLKNNLKKSKNFSRI